MPAWRSASPKKRKTRSREDLAHDRAAELRDVAEATRSSPWDSQPGACPMAHLITEISGWVASSVWVKT